MENNESIRVFFSFPEAVNVMGDLVFPVTKEQFQKMLDGVNPDKEPEFYVRDFSSDFLGTHSAPANGRIDVNELNYFAAKLSQMGEDDLEKFGAILESGRHRDDKGDGGSDLADLINIADNLDSFTFHRNMDEQGYGELLLTGPDNVIDKLKRQLQYSSSDRDQEFAQYVECLVEHADAEQFGRSMAYNNDGDFVDSGYIIEDGGFNTYYYGEQDIPGEYRIWEEPSVNFIKVTDVDLSTLLLQMHALGGNYTQDAARNLQTLMSGDCFITVAAEKMTAFSVAGVLHMDSEANQGFYEACDAGARVFFAGTHENGEGRIGNIHELVPDEVKSGVRTMSYGAVQIDVDFKDGTNRVFSPAVWSGLPDSERDRIAGAIERFDPIDEQNAETYLNAFRKDGETMGRAISADEFLIGLNSAFKERAQNQQPNMLRVARDAAQEMLAQGAEVYRLMPGNVVKLSPLDAMKSRGLWYSEHREFAIQLSGLDGLEKWAARKVGDIERQIERGALAKSRGDAEI